MKKAIIYILILTLLSCGSTKYKNNKKSNNELKGIETIHNNSINATFGKRFEQVKIIGIGESTHGSGTIDSLKYDFVKYLITKHKINTIALEANAFETNILSDLIQNNVNEIEIKKHIKFIPFNHFNFLSSQENLIFFKWLASWNQRQKIKIKIIGVDNQFSYNAILKLSQIIDSIPELKLYVEKLLKLHPTDTYVRMHSKKTIEYLNIVNLLFDKAKKIKINSTNYLKIIDLITQINNESLIKEQNWNNRDSIMANNLINYELNNPQSKVVFLSHNAHIANDKNFNELGTRMVGYYLKEFYGTKYFSIATCFKEGFYTAQDLDKLTKRKDSIGIYTSLSNNDNIVDDKLSATLAPVKSIENIFSNSRKSISIVNCRELKSFSELKNVSQRNIGLIKSEEQFFYKTDYSNFYDFIIVLPYSKAGYYLKSKE